MYKWAYDISEMLLILMFTLHLTPQKGARSSIKGNWTCLFTLQMLYPF